MKKLVLLLMLIVSLSESYSIEISIKNSLIDSINLKFSFPTIAFTGEYGVETDDDFIYTTQYNGDSLASYDLNGNLIEKFTIPGVGPMLDLAYDGDLIYGGSNDYFFYAVDMATKQLVVKWGMPIKVNAIAFDNGDDFFGSVNRDPINVTGWI